MVRDLILVGRFGAPHGVAGEVRLQSFTSIPRAIASYRPLFDASGTRQFSIVSLRLFKDTVFIAKIAGIIDRMSAGSLTNAELFVPRNALPGLEEEEYYVADLIGLSACTEAGETFGKVVDVLNFGGGDILEIVRTGGSQTVFWPFKKEIFPHINLTAGRLTVVPPIEVGAIPSLPEG